MPVLVGFWCGWERSRVPIAQSNEWLFNSCVAYRRTPAVQARLDTTRERILDAALALVAEHGYAGCSVAAVAARAQVATGSVYRHFPAKGDLFAEVFRKVTQREVEAVARVAGSNRPARQRAGDMVATFATRALRAPRLAYALLVEPVDPAVDVERLAFRRAFRGLVARALAEAIAAGEAPEQDVELTAAALVGAVAEALVGPLATGSVDADGGETIASLVIFTLRSVGGCHAIHP
jgi:AcrR family transcriptional regulator